MGKVQILETTTKYPLTLMGERAGICWGSDVTDPEKNKKRGIECLSSGHGRVAEFVNVEMVLDGYSARVIREWYTHIGGAPTRLQESTRYIDYYDNNSAFQYVIPPSIRGNEQALEEYEFVMEYISQKCYDLQMQGIPKEDVAMMLPLGMQTKVVDKRNLRNLIDMSHQRMCNRAYWEYRSLFKDISDALKSLSDEWEYVVKNYFRRKCDYFGYCPEKNSCGYFKKGL